jgi:CubicO group peptidase (beta-lactamase class C family)
MTVTFARNETAYTRLDCILKEITTRWGVPGMAVGIVDEGQIAYTRGFGMLSLETGRPVTPDSIFCIASISKCFVACAILQLVERGQLELDGKISQYLPYFCLDDERFTEITLRQMLSHTSGIPDMDESEYDELVAHPEYDEGAAERYVRSLSKRKMITDPGERFAYSNIAYNVLGDLIAKITRMTFENYMVENILRPSGMPESTFYFPDVPHERLAIPHLRVPGISVNHIYPYHRADAPSSFLHTTAVEMCHWAITNLNRGEYSGKHILNPASYELMWTPVAKRDVPPWREEMGLGWSLGHFKGRQVAGHGGGGFGWTCLLTLLPEAHQAVIVLSNEQSSAHELAMEAAVLTLFGEEPQAGKISWMIPIAQALENGGFQAAYDRYEEIRDNPDYFFDEYELTSLYYQCMSAGRLDLAGEVLELNIHVFPAYLGSYLLLSKHHLGRNDRKKTKFILNKALEVSPGNKAIVDRLEKIQEP